MTSSRSLQISAHSDLHGANTFLDEVTSQFLTCRLCLQPYRRPPKSLRCLHAFCALCLERHQDATATSTGHAAGPLGHASRPLGVASTSYRRYSQPKRLIQPAVIVCPVCSRTTELPPGGVCRLPDNSLLGQLGEVVHRLKETSQVEDTAADNVTANISSPLCDVCRSVREKTSILSGITQGNENSDDRTRHDSWRTVSRGEKPSDEETDSDSPEDEWRNKLDNPTVSGCSLSFRNSWTNITARKEPNRKRKRKSQGTFENLRGFSKSFDGRLDRDSKTIRREVATNDSRCSSSSGVSEISDEATTTEAAVAIAKCIDCNKLLCEDCRRHHRRLAVTSTHSLVDIECSSDVECRRHHGEPLRYYCQPCSVCICLLCTLDDHHHHEVTSLQDGMTLHRRSLVDLVDRCRQRRDQLRKHLDVVERADSERTETLAAIHRCANSAVAQIREKEEEMVVEVESGYGEEFDVILDERAIILEDLKTLDNICHLAEIILENNSVELLLMKNEMEEKCGKLLDKEVRPLPLSLSDTRSKRLCFTNENGLIMFGSVSTSEMSDASTETDAKFSADVRKDSVPPWEDLAAGKSKPLVTGSPQSCSININNSQQHEGFDLSRVVGEFDNSNSADLGKHLTMESERISKLDYLNCAIDNVVLRKTYFRRRDNSADKRQRFHDSGSNINILEENQMAFDKADSRLRDCRGIKQKIRSQNENHNLQISPVCEEDFTSDSSLIEADKVMSTECKATSDGRNVPAASFANISSYPIDIILDTDFVLEIDENLEITESMIPFYPSDSFVPDSLSIPESRSSARQVNGGGGFYVIVADVQVDVPLETFYVIVDDGRPDRFNCEEGESQSTDISTKDNNFQTEMAAFNKPESNSNLTNQVCVNCLSKMNITSGQKVTKISNCEIETDHVDSTVPLEQSAIGDKSEADNIPKNFGKEGVPNLVTNVIICANDDLKPIQYFDIQSPEVENIILRLNEGKLENTTSSKTDTCTQTVNQNNTQRENKFTSVCKADGNGEKIPLNEISRIVNSDEFKRISLLLKNNSLQSRHSSSLPSELNIITLLSSSDALINTTFRQLESTVKQREVAGECAQVAPIACFSSSERCGIYESSCKRRDAPACIPVNDRMEDKSKTEQIITELNEKPSELCNPDIKPDEMSKSTRCFNLESGTARNGTNANSDCSNDGGKISESSNNTDAASNDTEKKNKYNDTESTSDNNNRKEVANNKEHAGECKNFVDVGVSTEAIETRNAGIGEFNSVICNDVATYTDVSVNDATTSTVAVTVNDVVTSTDVVAFNDVTTSTVIADSDVSTCTDFADSNDVATSTDVASSDATTSTEATSSKDDATCTDIVLTSDRGCGDGMVTCECVGTITDQIFVQNICIDESRALFGEAFVTADGTNEQISTTSSPLINSESFDTEENFNTVSNGKDLGCMVSNGKDLGCMVSNGKDLGCSSKTLLPMQDCHKTSPSKLINKEDGGQSNSIECKLISDARKAESGAVKYTCVSELDNGDTVDWEGSDLDEAMIQAIPEVAIVTPEVVSFPPDVMDSKAYGSVVESNGHTATTTSKLDKISKIIHQNAQLVSNMDDSAGHLSSTTSNIDNTSTNSHQDASVVSSCVTEDADCITNGIEGKSKLIYSNITEENDYLDKVNCNGYTRNNKKILADSSACRKTEDMPGCSQKNEDSDTDKSNKDHNNALANKFVERKTVHIFELSEFDEDSETEYEEEEDMFSSCLALNDQDLSQTPSAEMILTPPQNSHHETSSILTQKFSEVPLIISENSIVIRQRAVECIAENFLDQNLAEVSPTEEVTRDQMLSPVQEEDPGDANDGISFREFQTIFDSLSSSVEAEKLDLKTPIDAEEATQSNSVINSFSAASVSPSVSLISEESDLTLNEQKLAGLGDQDLSDCKVSNLQSTGLSSTNKSFTETQNSYSDLVLLTDLPSFLALADRTFSASTSDIPTNQVGHRYHVMRLVKSDESLNKTWRRGRGLSSSETRLHSCKISPRISKEKESTHSETTETENFTHNDTNSALTYTGFFSDDSIYEYDAASGSLQVLEDDENFQSVTSLVNGSSLGDKFNQTDVSAQKTSQNFNGNDSTEIENISKKGNQIPVTTEHGLHEANSPPLVDDSSLRKCLQKPKLFISALFELLSISPTTELNVHCDSDRKELVHNAFDSKLQPENSEISCKNSVSRCEQVSVPVATKCEKNDGENDIGKELINRYLQISHSLDESSTSKKSTNDNGESLTAVTLSGEKINNLAGKNYAAKFSTPKFNVRVHKLSVLKRLDSYDKENSLN